MTQKEKKRILILVIIVLLIAAVMVISISKKGKQKAENPTEQNQQVNKEEFVQTLDDGTRLNTSTKLQETKRIEGLEISNFQITSKNNETLLLATVKNTSNTTQGDFLANIKIIDKEGNEIKTVQVLIPEVEAGKSKQLISTKTFDYANAYDFSITKVK